MADILVVDDMPLVRRALAALLLDSGHMVTEADNGKCAMQELDMHDFDLVITDVYMPERDGLEVIRYLRESDRETKIIAISGGGARQDAQSALTLTRYVGADLGLQKPIENEVLLEAVEALTNTARQ